MLGVGEEQAGFDPHDDDAWHLGAVVSSGGVHPGSCGVAPETGDVRLGGALQEQHEGGDDSDEQAGQGVEQHAEQGCEGGDGVGTRGVAVDPAEPGGPDRPRSCNGTHRSVRVLNADIRSVHDAGSSR